MLLLLLLLLVLFVEASRCELTKAADVSSIAIAIAVGVESVCVHLIAVSLLEIAYLQLQICQKETKIFVELKKDSSLSPGELPGWYIWLIPGPFLGFGLA